MRHHLEVFESQLVVLDGNEFEDCMFRDCTFLLTGTKPIKISKCSLDECFFQFGGPALNTVNFFREFRQAAGPEAYENLIKQMLEGFRR